MQRGMKLPLEQAQQYGATTDRSAQACEMAKISPSAGATDRLGLCYVPVFSRRRALIARASVGLSIMP